MVVSSNVVHLSTLAEQSDLFVEFNGGRDGKSIASHAFLLSPSLAFKKNQHGGKGCVFSLALHAWTLTLSREIDTSQKKKIEKDIGEMACNFTISYLF